MGTVKAPRYGEPLLYQYYNKETTMFIRHIPQPPEINKYFSDLVQYLEEHKFQIDVDYSELEDHAGEALDAFCDARLAGYSEPASEEIANQVLFQNIGESEYEVVLNILKDEFGDIIDLEDEDWQQFWVPKFLNSDIDIFEGCEVLKYGISAADIDINRDAIIGRIKEIFDTLWPTTD